MTSFTLFDYVELTEGLDDGFLPKKSRGYIVECSPEGDEFLVEFWDPKKKPLGIFTVRGTQLRFLEAFTPKPARLAESQTVLHHPTPSTQG